MNTPEEDKIYKQLNSVIRNLSVEQIEVLMLEIYSNKELIQFIDKGEVLITQNYYNDCDNMMDLDDD